MSRPICVAGATMASVSFRRLWILVEDGGGGDCGGGDLQGRPSILKVHVRNGAVNFNGYDYVKAFD